MRVWVSDLLFPGSPETPLAALAVAKGRGLVLAPHCREESAPDWTGNVEFRDSESDARRLQHVSRETLARHAEAYARHFAMWSDAPAGMGSPLPESPRSRNFLTRCRPKRCGLALWKSSEPWT